MEENSPRFSFVENGNEKRIVVSGELSYYHLGAFRDALRYYLDREQCPLNFILDLHQCDFVDSGCLGMIAEFKKEVDRRGCSLRIENVSPHVSEAMRRIRLHTIIDISGMKE
mgnify:CR=1 FL=1